MRILLIDFDGKLPNLALMKLSSWHKAQGDEVYLNSCEKPDKVYISTLFTWNRPKVEKLLQVYPDAEVGGTGWDFIAENDKWKGVSHDLPPEIEAMKPDYDLYTVMDIYERIKRGIGTKAGKMAKAKTIANAGIGLSSRGCIRDCCWYCIVRIKEGAFHQVAEISDLLNSRSNVLILLDNNLTADPDVIEKLHEIRDRGLTVDISQGIDIRLVTPEIAQASSEVKHFRSLHYAWDLMEFERQVREGIGILSASVKKWRHMCFMLTCYNTTFEEDVYRFRRIREMNIDPYVMPYNKAYPSEKHHHFARWVNGRIYKKCSFEEYKPWVKAQRNTQMSLF